MRASLFRSIACFFFLVPAWKGHCLFFISMAHWDLGVWVVAMAMACMGVCWGAGERKRMPCRCRLRWSGQPRDRGLQPQAAQPALPLPTHRIPRLLSLRPLQSAHTHRPPHQASVSAPAGGHLTTRADRPTGVPTAQLLPSLGRTRVGRIFYILVIFQKKIHV